VTLYAWLPTLPVGCSFYCSLGRTGAFLACLPRAACAARGDAAAFSVYFYSCAIKNRLLALSLAAFAATESDGRKIAAFSVYFYSCAIKNRLLALPLAAFAATESDGRKIAAFSVYFL
jgi:hypothetical protein